MKNKEKKLDCEKKSSLKLENAKRQDSKKMMSGRIKETTFEKGE